MTAPVSTPDTPTAPPVNWTDLTIHAVPIGISTTLEKAGLGLDRCRLCVPSRVLLNGQYGESWLALGPEKMAIVAQNGHGPEVLWQAATTELTGVRTQSVTGGGILVVDVKGAPQEILRFDAGQATLFGGIAQKLNKHVAPKKPDAPTGPAVPSGPPAAPESPPSETAQPETAAPVTKPASAVEPAPVEPLDFNELLAKQRELHCPRCLRLFPKNTKVCPFCVARTATLRRILSFADESRGALVIMGILMITGILMGLVQPLLQKYLIDDVLKVNATTAGFTIVDPVPYDHLLWVVLAMAGLLIFTQVINIVRTRIGVVVGCNVTNTIQKKAYFHLQTLSMSYFNKQQTGSLLSRISNDARQMQNFLAEGIQYTVINVLQIVGIACVLLYMNWFLALMVLIPAPLMVALSAWVWRKVHRRFALLWSATAAVTAHLNDSLSGIRVVKAFGQEHLENEKFDKKVTTSKDRWIEAEQTWQTFVPILNFIAACSGLLIWYFGGCQMFGEYLNIWGLTVIAKPLTFGELTAFIWFLGMITGPLQLLTRLNDWLTRSLTAAARVFEILDAEPEIKEAADPHPMPDCQGNIRFRDVTFGYEKHKPVLKGVDLEIKPGEMIGLVGPSGAGKSTIINIIGRLYDVDEGGLYLDGVDIKNIKLDDLRKHVGYVLQDNFLFNGSVAENIAYARPDATREEIIAAAIAANAHSFILNMSDGYDTLCGERGERLSGGERQRISIARAILHNPKILILDEATSSVDTETEARIQMAMTNLIQGRTTIAIAHRLSTLRHASRLIVIEDGKVAESGTHDELMNKEGGVYRKLVTIQTEWSRQIGVGG